MIDILKIRSEWTLYHDLNRLTETVYYNAIRKKKHNGPAKIF